MSVGETWSFTVSSFDTPRRGIDLALVVGSRQGPAPTPSETDGDDEPAPPTRTTSSRGTRRGRRPVAATDATTDATTDDATGGTDPDDTIAQRAARQ